MRYGFDPHRRYISKIIIIRRLSAPDKGVYMIKDNTAHPHHYDGNGLDVFSVIKAFAPDEYSFHMGNVIKYVLRSGKKGDPEDYITDLEKAKVYIDKMIDILRAKQNNSNPTYELHQTPTYNGDIEHYEYVVKK